MAVIAQSTSSHLREQDLFNNSLFTGYSFFAVFFLLVLLPDFGDTIAPFSLASGTPIAIACFGLVNFFLIYAFRFTFSIRFIAASTLFSAPFENFAILCILYG
ncbi:MAG: hypothetical protein ABI760_18280 [Ferruginibacter sp.]